MPLTTAKLNHIAKVYTRALAKRQQTITLVCRNSDGTTTTLSKPAIWRPVEDADPLLAGSAHTPGSTDVLAMFMLTDISLQQLRSAIYCYPSAPAGAEPANRYVITALAPKGFPAGTDRIFVTLKRQR